MHREVDICNSEERTFIGQLYNIDKAYKNTIPIDARLTFFVEYQELLEGGQGVGEDRKKDKIKLAPYPNTEVFFVKNT